MSESELLQLLRRHSPVQAVLSSRTGDRGLADEAHFPFLALVSQTEMKLALVLTLINPAAGGVLLIGPRARRRRWAGASMVLCHRCNRFMNGYLAAHAKEERELATVVCAPYPLRVPWGSARKGARR